MGSQRGVRHPGFAVSHFAAGVTQSLYVGLPRPFQQTLGPQGEMGEVGYLGLEVGKLLARGMK